MAAFLAANTTALASSTFTLTSGQTTTLGLTPAAVSQDAEVDVQYQLDNGEWQYVGRMNMRLRVCSLTSPGTYRVFRYACATPVGVDRD